MLHSDLNQIIQSHETFAIIAHTSPDGDCMGSMLGLYKVLYNLGKRVHLFIDDKLPDKYSFLPNYNVINASAAEYYEVIFILDCGDLDRIGGYKSLIENCQHVVNIDHHITNTSFGNTNIVDSKASSTGEMIFRTVNDLGLKFDKESATCLYTAMLTDTGGFKYSNTSPDTLRAAASLIAFGFDFPGINDIIFNRKSESKVRLTTLITSTLELVLDGKVAMMLLTRDMLEKTNAKEEDADEVVNIGRDIEGVEVSVFIKEKSKDLYRVSLRANNNVDVSKVASKFGGGGHVKAAGLSFDGSFEMAKESILNEIGKQLY